MAFSIVDLFVAPTEAQVLDNLLDSITLLGIPIRSWPDGGTGRTIVAVVAKLYAMFAALVTTVVRSGFLETAEGGWLTYIAYYVYGVTRFSATFASGSVVLTNSQATPVTRAANTVRFLNKATGKAYVNTGGFTLPASGTVTVPIMAVEIGTASTSGPGAINALETFIIGVTVTNPSAVAGSDPETDATLRVRCLARLGTLSPLGPRDAYLYAALSAVRTDGTSVGVNRVTVGAVNSTGTVQVYAATAGGPVTSTDLPFIVDSVEKYARPDSVAAVVSSALVQAYTATITIWVSKAQAGATTADSIASAASLALTNALVTYPIGGLSKDGVNGYLWSDFVAGTIKASNLAIFDVDLSTTTDVALPAGYVATNAATIIVRIV